MKPILGPQGQRCTRLEMHLTTTCPERCVFCSEDERMRTFKKYPTSWGRVARTLRDYAARGIEHLHLTGGEPTIHPRFLDVLRLARKLGMRTSIGTIGTKLCEPDFAAQALPLLDEALFSIHGPDAATHDALTRVPGSFDKQLRAVALARQLNPDFMIAVNTVMCRPNIEQLPETVAFLDGLRPQLIVISNTTPEGAAYEHYPELAVPLTTLKRVLAQVPERAEHAVLRFFGVPMCLLAPEHRMLSNDLHWDPRVTVEWNAQPGKVAFSGWPAWDPGRKRGRVAACTDCSMQGVCMGVYNRYAELWPVEELTPLV